MNEQLFIPDRIKVGYNNRKDTYTGKLAYVIYFDKKGVLRKETSWESWRDDKITPHEFDNKPMSGFVLNKGVGGARESYGWNARNEYIRIYDPRNFEFEISVANLLFILQESNCMRGKGLEGEFVYAWDGKDLVLLPVGSKEYKNSVEFTDMKTMKVASKDLIVGATYETKDQQTVIYLGQFNMFDYNQWSSAPNVDIVRVHAYYYPDNVGNMYKENFAGHRDMSQIARLIDPTPVGNYAELVDELNKHKNFGKYIDFKVNDLGVIQTKYDRWGVRRMKDDKMNGGVIFKQLAPNSFAEIMVTLTNSTTTKGEYYYSSGSTIFHKCLLTQTRIITFNEDGTIDLKTKKVVDDTLYPISDLNKNGEYKVVTIKIKNSNKIMQLV